MKKGGLAAALFAFATHLLLADMLTSVFAMNHVPGRQTKPLRAAWLSLYPPRIAVVAIGV
jgi:hypothetical protein